MKRYYLRFTSSDFIKSGKIWRTSIYDLYNNSQYKNYSVKKANYGCNLLGDGTYTGMNRLSASTSEIGFVESGRFIDCSGRIDLIDWQLNVNSTQSTSVNSYLSVYNTDDVTLAPVYAHSTPSLVNDWISRNDLEPGFPLYMVQAQRYAYFELFFDTELSSVASIDLELLITIEIDAPVTDGYFGVTKKIQNKFPEWMDIREYNPLDIENATPATPSSTGGKIINAIAGEWLTDLSSRIRYQEYQSYIDTADLTQKDWVYVAPGLPYPVWSVVADGIQLARTKDIGEFYESAKTDDCFFWNVISDEIYTNKKYSNLYVNGVKYNQNPHQLWNSFDD